MRRLIFFAAISASWATQSAADCLTAEERRAARDKYKICMMNADSDFGFWMHRWEVLGCDNPGNQPKGCVPPLPLVDKARTRCLEELKAGVYE